MLTSTALAGVSATSANDVWALDSAPNVGSTDNLRKAASRIPGTTTAWAVGSGGPRPMSIRRS